MVPAVNDRSAENQSHDEQTGGSNEKKTTEFSDFIDQLIHDETTAQRTERDKPDAETKDKAFLSEIISQNSNQDIPKTKSETDKTLPPGQEMTKSETDIFRKRSDRQMHTSSDSSSTDDFYSRFGGRSSSIVSPGWSPEEETTIEEAVHRDTLQTTETNTKDLQNRLADTWTEFLAPGNSKNSKESGTGHKKMACLFKNVPALLT